MKKAQVSRTRVGLPAMVSPVSSKLTMAELSLQRGEFETARNILEKRIGQGHDDFKTGNMLGISLANLRQYEEAVSVFRNLRGAHKARQQKIKAGFNLGLARFYQDLHRTGDLSIARHHGPGVALVPLSIVPATPFDQAIVHWEQLLHGRPPYRDIIYTFLSLSPVR